MGLFGKNRSLLSSQNQLLYALLVVIVVPLILILNSLWLMDRFHHTLEIASQQEAALVEDIIGSLGLPNDYSANDLSVLLTKMAGSNSRIKWVSYLKHEKGSETKYSLYASSNAESGSVDLSSDMLQFISEKHQAYVGLTKDPRTDKFAWMVVSEVDPLRDGSELLLVMHLDASSMQVFLSDISREALVVLVFLIIFVLMLLFNHLRFYDYSQLYTQLKQLDQMKDDFFSTASHEIRTPLTSIAGYASLAMDDFNDSETVKHALQVISTSSSRLSSLVENLLDVSRIEQGRVVLTPARVPLVATVGAIYDELRLQADDKRLQFVHQSDGSEIYVLVDPEKLKQILYNIIGNSLKYTLQGSITLSYSVENNMATLCVRDTGIGMTADQLKHLFSKFYRAHDDSTQKVYGTGLGLWITKQLIELMQGKIRVESVYGSGSTFYISFPLAH